MINHREGPYLVRNRLFDRKVAKMEKARSRSKTTLKNNMKLFVFNAVSKFVAKYFCKNLYRYSCQSN